MRLTLQVNNALYPRLINAADRSALERVLADVMGSVTVEEMWVNGRVWKRGDNGKETAEVEKRKIKPQQLTQQLTELPDEALVGQTCSIKGG